MRVCGDEVVSGRGEGYMWLEERAMKARGQLCLCICVGWGGAGGVG